MPGRVIFVGNLPLDITVREVEDLFRKCGRITDIDLKTPSRPPGESQECLYLSERIAVYL